MKISAQITDQKLKSFFEQNLYDEIYVLPGEPDLEIIYSQKSPANKLDQLYKNLFEQNEEIFLVAGELNPYFYKQIIDEYSCLLKKISINIICGPYIAVKDELFQKYHDIHNNKLANWWYAKKKDQWWKAHPVFELAYENSNVNINIIKPRCENHFCFGTNTRDIFFEERYEELSLNKGKLCRGNERLTNYYLRLWQTLKEKRCYKWDKEKPEETPFKPLYVIGREKEIEKELKKEIESLISQGVGLQWKK